MRRPDTEAVSVERLVEAAGVTLSRETDHATGACPFHEASPAQLIIDYASNTWVCPTCMPEGGGPVEWVMMQRGVSRTRATDMLHGELGEDSAGKIEWPDNPEAVVHAVADYYHRTLRGDEEALAYLERRGLRDEALIGTLVLGYANRTLGYRLPSRDSQRGKEVREGLQATGIMRGSGHEHLSGSLVVPVRDRDGKVVELYGRKVRNDLRRGTPQHLFLHEQAPPPWLLDPANADTATLIITSSVTDALSWWVAGLHGVLVVPTMAATAEEVRAALAERKLDRAVIAFRRTKPADEAAFVLVPTLTALGMNVHRAVFPHDQDANDLLVKGLDLAALARNAEWMAHGVGREPSPRPTPEPATVAEDVAAAASVDEVVQTYGDRRWRVRGLENNTSPEVMRVNVMVTREEVGMHVDSFDLYSHRHRAGFTKQAAIEIGVEEKVIKADIGKLLLHLEDLQDQRLREAQQRRHEAVHLTRAEQDEALELLRDPKLIDRIVGDLGAAGLVGEDANKLVCYLAATSRLLDDPLAVVIQSSSAAGKSTLLDGVLDFIPDEHRFAFSAMTGQSLYYLGEHDLEHRVLAIAEEEGASRASYSLKLLQSQKTITIASTGKDPGTGRLRTETYRVEGPVAIMMTTTAADIDEELQNRCIVLTVDEGRTQTRAIHERQRQRETLAGVIAATAKASILRVHQNAQRLLRPLAVVNPHAAALTFDDHVARTRRDHTKYLGLIRTIALLHQHQRPTKTAENNGTSIEYIEVEPDDIALANKLCREILGRSLDELAPQTRTLLDAIHAMVVAGCALQGVDRADFRFTRRELREHTGWGQTQLRLHLGRLVDFEYVLAHRRGPRGHAYELAWSGEGRDGSRFLVGLADPPSDGTASVCRAEEGALPGQRRADIGPLSGDCRVAESTESPGKDASICTSDDDTSKTHVHGKARSRSYKGRGKKG